MAVPTQGQIQLQRGWNYLELLSLRWRQFLFGDSTLIPKPGLCTYVSSGSRLLSCQLTSQILPYTVDELPATIQQRIRSRKVHVFKYAEGMLFSPAQTISRWPGKRHRTVKKITFFVGGRMAPVEEWNPDLSTRTISPGSTSRTNSAPTVCRAHDSDDKMYTGFLSGDCNSMREIRPVN